LSDNAITPPFFKLTFFPELQPRNIGSSGGI
jgi:hypothetical protein